MNNETNNQIFLDNDTAMRRFHPFETYHTKNDSGKLKIDVSGATSLEDALDRVGMNFDLEKAPLLLEDGTPVENYAMILKEDDKTQLGVVGKNYSQVSFKEAWEPLTDFVKTGEYEFKFAGVALDGKNQPNYAKGFIGLKGPDFEIMGRRHESYITGSTTHDGSGGNRIGFTSIDLVCTNGLMIGKLAYAYIKHSKNMDVRFQEVKDIIEKQHYYHIRLQELSQELYETQFSKQDFVKHVIPAVRKEMGMDNDETRLRGHDRSEIIADRLMQAWESSDAQAYGNTLYRTMLSLTDFETHNQGFRTMKNDTYLERVMGGMVLTNVVLAQAAALKGINMKKYNK